ncbi:tRNA (guanosine(18)-2'-O)-methyltransferase [Austwickia sp. TVS 96-490-7B]|uniref:TrmH family RNA methyltransferase n=1 Tax=Austwickia sp. TVS 96-490-7B TaxID=2830843 RepID=UPI001D447748|nr:TrmH family RNA methyltransferase [Austwickia sp. TVS 96-490-7B]MBW3085480.1 tRNA (guanosine(18)-2'-O)-methyltransferase [Austwickia sp. TVS 96-490-7B]
MTRDKTGTDETVATAERTVGVGPWPGGEKHWPRTTSGDIAAPYDPELLAHGDRRNVDDRYRYWRHDAIVADLDTHRHALHIAVENWEHDFNIGSIIRTANAFNVGAFHIVGKRRWNRRGAMVTDRYQHEHHHAHVSDLLDWARAHDYTVLAVDNMPGSVPLETFDLPRRALMVFGQEGPGLSEPALTGADAILHITQFGSTRSLNAGAAAAIAMHAWVRAHATITR